MPGLARLSLLILLLLKLLLLALQLLQELLWGFGCLLGGILILLRLIGGLLVSVRIFSSVIVHSDIRGRTVHHGGLREALLRYAAIVGSRHGGVGSAGSWRQNDTLNRVRIGPGTYHHVIEVRAIQQVGKYFAGGPGTQVSDHTFVCTGGNVKLSTCLFADFLQHVGQGGVMGYDSQFAVGKMYAWRNGGYLFKRERLQRGWSVSRERRSRFFLFRLFFCRFAYAALLGEGLRCESRQGQAHRHRERCEFPREACHDMFDSAEATTGCRSHTPWNDAKIIALGLAAAVPVASHHRAIP